MIAKQTVFWLLYFEDDLSNNKFATQSPIYPGSPKLYGAHNAVDRNTLTCMRTEQIGRNSPYKTMRWKVDLGGLYNIYSINILFQNYVGEGMLVYVFLSVKRVCTNVFRIINFLRSICIYGFFTNSTNKRLRVTQCLT